MLALLGGCFLHDCCCGMLILPVMFFVIFFSPWDKLRRHTRTVVLGAGTISFDVVDNDAGQVASNCL